MKLKIGIVGAVALMTAGAGFAADSGTAAAGTAMTVAVGDCANYMNHAAALTLNVSKNTVGAWDCTGTGIGVAAGSFNGTKAIFTGSSAGGKIDKSASTCSAAACTEAATAAATASGASSSSGS